MPLDLTAFINKHLKFRKGVDYNVDELMELIEMVKSTMCRENGAVALIDVPIPVKIIGDIHGQFFDLQRIFLAIGLPGSHRFLFLGDYVDRGPNSVECIALLLALKLAVPNRISLIDLLRGNHETTCVNSTYGFREELKRRFKTDIATKLYKELNTIFSYLPLAALVRDRILCMHGGISPKLQTIDDIRQIRLPIDDPAAGTLEEDFMWADPEPNMTGFEFNKPREVSVRFGEDEVKNVCRKNGLDFIIRGHQLMNNGFEFFANMKLVTIFSAPRYQPKRNNKGGIVVIDENMHVSLCLLNPVDNVQSSGKENFERTFNEFLAQAAATNNNANNKPAAVESNDNE